MTGNGVIIEGFTFLLNSIFVWKTVTAIEEGIMLLVSQIIDTCKFGYQGLYGLIHRMFGYQYCKKN